MDYAYLSDRFSFHTFTIVPDFFQCQWENYQICQLELRNAKISRLEWPRRLTARTRPFQGWKTSSNLVGVTLFLGPIAQRQSKCLLSTWLGVRIPLGSQSLHSPKPQSRFFGNFTNRGRGINCNKPTFNLKTP